MHTLLPHAKGTLGDNGSGLGQGVDHHNTSLACAQMDVSYYMSKIPGGSGSFSASQPPKATLDSGVAALPEWPLHVPNKPE